MRADAKAKRQAILDAAWVLYAERGTDVPMRTVALEADVGVATLYRHFPTADDLVFGLLREAFARIEAIVEAQLEVWDADPQAAWSGAVRKISELGIGALFYQFAPRAAAIPHMVEDVEPLRNRMLAVFDRLAARARAAGLLDPDFESSRVVIGIAAISRPLPDKLSAVVPDQTEWMVERYIAGLVPVPRRPEGGAR